jgi:hypothetical protein
MTKKKSPSDKLTISLRENGLHSLWRGIDSYGIYDEKHDKLVLKDAIMFLHHGVELLMKEILVAHSPFLIFEDLKDAASKQKQANDSGMGIFFLEKPPKTVTYEEAIKRVSAFIQPPELTEKLQNDLKELNRFRNQLEHYAIETDKELITQLLAALHEPLLNLFERQLGSIRKVQPERVNRVWREVEDKARFYNMAEKEVFELVEQFNGQKVPGQLFNRAGEFTLPEFEKIYPNHLLSTNGIQHEFDIFCEGKEGNWVVEVKGGHIARLESVAQIHRRSRSVKAQAWFVTFSEVTASMREFSQENNVLLTGISELRELQKILLSQNAG